MQIGFGRAVSPDALRSGDAADRTREISRHLGSFFLKELIDQMWKTVPEGGLVKRSTGEKLFRGFLNEKLAFDLSEKLPIGAKPARRPEFAAGALQNGPAGADTREWRG